MGIIKGWKNTNKNLECIGFKFEVGKSYKQDGKIKLCSNGFHFHENRFDIFKYYGKDDSLVLEVEATGEVVTGDDKSVCSDIKIIRILTDEEIKELCNLKTNTGLHNSGHSNSGDSNSGDWNKSNYNTGCFNTDIIDTINIFNKPCDRKKWEQSNKPNFIFFNLTFWIPESKMTDQEKKDHAYFYCPGGYLKTLSYKEAWRRAWEGKYDGDLEKLEALPNFNWEVFTEISGIEKPD